MKRLAILAALLPALVWGGDFVTNPAATLPGPWSGDADCVPGAGHLCSSELNTVRSGIFDLREPLLTAPLVTTSAWSSLGNEKVIPVCTTGITWSGTAFGCYTYSPPTRPVASDGVLLSTTAAIPTCESAVRGLYWVVRGGAGVADLAYVCMKGANDAYAWFPLATGGASPPQTLTAIVLNDATVTAGGSVQIVGAFTGGVAGDANWYASAPTVTTAPGATDNAYGTVTAAGVYTAPASGVSQSKVWAVAKNDVAVYDSSTVSITTVSAYPPSENPITSTATLGGQPVVAKPALLGTITNVFGTLGASYNTTTRFVSTYRHHYAKTSVWNIDESSAIVCNTSTSCQNSTTNNILDGQTFAVQYTSVSTPGGHRQWSGVSPDYGFGLTMATMTWYKWFRNGDAMVAPLGRAYANTDFGLGSLTKLRFANDEGGLDNGDTAAALIANDTVPLVINPVTAAMRCKVTAGGGYGATVSDATVSQDGAYLIVNYESYGLDAYAVEDDGDCAFLHRLSTATSHHDACVESNGAQVSVQATGNTLRKVDLSTGVASTIFGNNNSRWHVSCRNTKRPGWVYVSHDNRTYDATQTSANNKSLHRVFAVKLDGSGTVENYAWDRATEGGSYEQEASVCPSPSGTRVWWKGGWNTGTDVHSYVAEKP